KTIHAIGARDWLVSTVTPPRFGSIYFNRSEMTAGPPRVTVTLAKDAFNAVLYNADKLPGKPPVYLAFSKAAKALTDSISEDSMLDTLTLRQKVKALVDSEADQWKLKDTGFTADSFKKMVNESLEDYSKLYGGSVGDNDVFTRTRFE